MAAAETDFIVAPDYTNPLFPTTDTNDAKMVQSEEEVLKAAQAILEQKQYQKLRNFIWVSDRVDRTNET